MIRKLALLAGAAGLMAAAGTAVAQDVPSPAPETPAAATQPQSLTLQPGASVTGSDGVRLGALEGARTNATGQQELTVRGDDGQLRAVPLGGLRQEGAGVVVGWTSAEYTASPAITPDAGSSAQDASGTTATPPASDPAQESPPDISGSTDPEPAPQPGAEPLPAEPQA